MWSKVARLASPAPRRPSATTTHLRADEPSFIRLAESLRAQLSPSTDSRSSDLVQIVRAQLSQVLAILQVESVAKQDGAALGPCLEYALKEGLFKTLVDLVEVDDPPGVRFELVEWFSRAIVELDEGFLAHGAVNKPLLKLLRACVDDKGGPARDEELAVVETMCIICERIKTRPELLAIFLRHKPSIPRKDPSPSLASSTGRPNPFTRMSSISSEGRPNSPTLSEVSASEISTVFSYSNASTSDSRRQRSERDFLLFAYLLRFIHREGPVGESARRGILTLCDVALGYPDAYTPSFSTLAAARSPSASTATSPNSLLPDPTTREAVLAFAEYLLDSDFAEVLGAGLGALYGLLPGKLVVRKATGGDQASEVIDGIVSDPGQGMQLGGMGALGEESDADELLRKRDEEESRLRSNGVGISGSVEVREGVDGFLTLVEFTQEVLKRCVAGSAAYAEDSTADEPSDSRQRELLLTALTDYVLSSVRNLFLRSVLYPSILECSETDGSAVAVMSYIDALLDVVHDGTQLEGAILEFLLGDDEDTRVAEHPQGHPRPPQTRRIKPRKSSALLLLEQASNKTRDSSSYLTSSGRFSLQDLLATHLNSSSQATATAALKLLSTILTKHDRWSLALLDVVLDEGATSFPKTLQHLDESHEGVSIGPTNISARDSDEDSDCSEDEFVYSPSNAPATPRPSTSRARPVSNSHASSYQDIAHSLPRILPGAPSVTIHLDHLDTLFSLVSSIDTSYRQSRAVGGASEMLSSGFVNYLRDAELSLAADRGFKRGVLVDPSAIGSSTRQPRSQRSTLFSSRPGLRGRDFAAGQTEWKHRLKPTGDVVALLLESFSHFFSHAPDVNLALTSVFATLATYPYRSLDGWILPVLRTKPAVSEFEEFIRDGERSRKPTSDDGDDRSVDFEIEERSRQAKFLSPTPRTPYSDPSNPPQSATRAALARSDSLLSVLDALVKSINEYRRKIPKFDTYLSERRQGLFFVENLAEALNVDDLAPLNSSLSPPAVPITVPVPSPPKLRPSGLASFFSPRRPSHARSPSTPLNKTFSSSEQSAARPSPLRRSASNGSIASGLAVPPPPSPGGSTTTKTTGPSASPFVTHYRKTGSITVEPVVVSTPNARHRTKLVTQADTDDEAEEDDKHDEADGIPDSPSRRLSPLASLGAHDKRVSTGGQVPSQKQTVTLSTILDNVIVLEEFIKELSAIIFVRREVGIDAVRFV
ncbi:uncharacterized protein JCM15063_002583 [Sporobolomyces koalae]|uniref:uncharacterized protein n=1 Tax=Sporobolomyces koalae TaxID=500713 RepID=UPI0031708AAF